MGLKELEKLGRRAVRSPRMRRFEWLGSTVVVAPMDVFPYRNVARMWIGQMYGFQPDEVVNLRARRLPIGKHSERSWWVMAIPNEAVDRQRRKPEDRPINRLGRAAQEQKRSRRPHGEQKRSDG